MLSVFELIEKRDNDKLENANWIPACGGTETPFMCNGYRLLYCWNGLSGYLHRNAYINLDTDMPLMSEELNALGFN